MRCQRSVAMLLAFCFGAGVGVASAANPAGLPPNGEETRAWLQLQKSGNASLGAPRPMTGEVADQVYRRYLESFTRPVPEDFERESFGAGSGGGGGGGGQ